MRSIDWKNLLLNDGVLAEPVREDGRITLWLPDSEDGVFQYWDRIMASAGDETAEQGVVAVAAVAVRARGGTSTGLLGRLGRRFGRRNAETTWALPNGNEVERCGERRTDVAIAWTAGGAETLDEAAARRRWPNLRRFQPLAPGVFLVEGLDGVPKPTADSGESAAPADLAALGEQAVEEARRRGDALAESLALTDRGMIAMNAGDAASAVSWLQQALALCRGLNDRGRETDVLCNLGYAQLGADDGRGALQTLDSAVVLARETGDVYNEKLALERLSLALLKYNRPADALTLADRALEKARSVGDQHQEPRLLWMRAIALADLNQPDQAIAGAEASIDFLRAHGKPEAAWYEAQLERFRSEATPLGGTPAAMPPPTFDPLFAGVVTTATAAPQSGGPTRPGPGLLRMALTATKAMATFIGSGMKPAPADVQQARLAVCASCEHHTGLRCRICGCFTNVKVKMLHEQCPIGKWPA